MLWNDKKTIENIQILPKIAEESQKMTVYLQGCYIDQADNYNLNVL